MAKAWKGKFVTLEMPKGDILGANMRGRIDRFIKAEEKALATAAKTAQDTSRRDFSYRRPANAVRRLGRSSTGGKFTRHVRWRPTGSGLVEFDHKGISKTAPHWIILEIGTGQRAAMRSAGVKLPRGRPAGYANYIKTVKSQVGRPISAGLAWGTGPSGQYTAPGAASGQQLHVRRQLRGRPRYRNFKRMVISKEIKGQHFVKQGGVAGWREYRTSARAAARRAFGGQKYRP